MTERTMKSGFFRSLRLTSPLVLIAVCAALAAGIAWVDRGHVQPYLAKMNQQNVTELAFESQQRVVAELAEEMSHVDHVCRQLTAPAGTTADDLALQLPESATLSDVSIAVILDDQGAPVFLHIQEHDNTTQLTDTMVSIGLTRQFTQIRSTQTGLMAFATDAAPRVMTYSMRPLPPSTPDTEPTHYLVLGREITQFLPTDVQLMGQQAHLSDTEAIQLENSLTLFMPDMRISWPLFGPDEKPLAYLEAQSGLDRHMARSQGTRRMTVSILCLAVGLTLLIITGIYILITGPIYRLVGRLRSSKLADGDTSGLSEGLHGEAKELAETLTETFERLAEMSQTDALTELANRRHFEQAKESMFNQAVRYNWPLSLIVIDVDYFKSVNDTAGHDLGDELLKTVSHAIQKASRKTDLPARVGGDEFALLLPETTLTDARTIAERIRQELASEDVIPGADAKISLSIGVAGTELVGAGSAHDLQVIADKALYIAKENGRDRVVVASAQNDDRDDSAIRDDAQAFTLYKKRISQDARFKRVFLSTMHTFIGLFEKRAPHMADHARKTQHYAVMIARQMELSDNFVQRIQLAACMHNVGMLMLPDSILHADTALTDEQLELVRQHPTTSAEIMEQMELLTQEIPAVLYHHEAFDGSGYPEGLSGAAIPLAARIIAVADAFDAMTTDRAYRAAMPFDQALDEIRAGAGGQFDPQVVDALLAIANREGEKILWETPEVDLRPIKSVATL
jgi:diguanylate cyclase (GGDEF)-like protein